MMLGAAASVVCIRRGACWRRWTSPTWSAYRSRDDGTSWQLLAEAAKGLEGAGADHLLLCTNTMHKVADQVQAAVSIPLLHLADATAQAVRRAGLSNGVSTTRLHVEAAVDASLATTGSA